MLKKDNGKLERFLCILFGSIFGMLFGMTIAVIIIAGITWCCTSLFLIDLASVDLFTDVAAIGSIILAPISTIIGGVYGSKTLFIFAA